MDDDQYELFKDSDPEQANIIVSSVIKKVDVCVYNCIERYVNGTLPFGQTEEMGLKEDMVGLAENENYERVVPEDIREYINDLKEKVYSGEIVVTTNIGADVSMIEEAKDRIKP